MRKELEEMRDTLNGRFELYVGPLRRPTPNDATDIPKYCLNKPPAEWNGGVGFVSKEMIEKHMPSGGVGSATHGEGEKVLMCGPPPMMTAMKWVFSSVFIGGR